jgi:hypothetical protein
VVACATHEAVDAGDSRTLVGVWGTADAAADQSATGDAACSGPLPAQATFGGVGQGDVNPSFQSAVGALGAKAMYIFSGATTSVGDGGAATQEIYAQAFDAKTGVSKGPSAPLFSPPPLDFESGSYMGGAVNLFEAAVASTGEIAIIYNLVDRAASGAAVYVAFVKPSTAADGGVQGLQLQHVELISTKSPFGIYDHPQIFWSNASQTFVVNYVVPAQSQGSFPQMAIDKYTASGQKAGGVPAVPLYPGPFMVNQPAGVLGSGWVGESGNLLGAVYADKNLLFPNLALTAIDESFNLVGAPQALYQDGVGSSGGWGIAGTSKGFVVGWADTQELGVVFVPTSGGGIGPQTTGATLGQKTSPLGPYVSYGPYPVTGRVTADAVETGGRGGVGVALLESETASYAGPPPSPESVYFAYLNAGVTELEGPSKALPSTAGTCFSGVAGELSISLTNFNGTFAIAAYSNASHSAQIVTTTSCP